MFTEDQLKDTGFWDNRLKQVNKVLSATATFFPFLKIVRANEWFNSVKVSVREANGKTTETIDDKFKDHFEKIIKNFIKKGLGDQDTEHDDIAFGLTNNNEIKNDKVKNLEKKTKKDQNNRASFFNTKYYALMLIVDNGESNENKYYMKDKKGNLVEFVNKSPLAYAVPCLAYPNYNPGTSPQEISEYEYEVEKDDKTKLNKEINYKLKEGSKIDLSTNATYTVNRTKPLVYFQYLAGYPDMGGYGAMLFYAVASVFRGIPIVIELDPIPTDWENLRKYYQRLGSKNIRELKDTNPLRSLFEFIVKYRILSLIDTNPFDNNLPNIWMVYPNGHSNEYNMRGLYVANS